MKDQIDPGAGGVEGRLAAAGMRYRLLAEAVDLADHDVGLFLGEGGDEFAIVAPLDAVERDFDAVDAVFDLTTDLFDGFGVTVVTSFPIEVSGAPIQVGYQSVKP